MRMVSFDGAGDPYIECGRGGGTSNGDGGTLTLVASVVSGNQAEGNGGSIHVGPVGLLRLIDGAVQDNRSGGRGGGLYVRGTLEYPDSILAGCIIGGEGGIQGQGHSPHPERPVGRGRAVPLAPA